MGRKAVRLELSSEIFELLKQECQKRKLEKQYYDRFQILLLCSQGLENKSVAEKLGCDCRKVSLWRNRWVERTSVYDLTIDEDGNLLSDVAIIQKIKEILSDNFRCGCPAKITEKEWAKLQTLACESPEKYGLPFTTWTHVELSKAAAVHLGISISPSRYGVLLKKRFTSA